MEYKEGNKVKVLHGIYAGRIGIVIALHLKDISLEFEDGDKGSFSYFNVEPLPNSVRFIKDED